MAFSANIEPDMTLVAELLEDIQRHPPAVAAKTLLSQHYISIGWYDAASDYVEDLKRDAPNDPETLSLTQVVQQKKASALKLTLASNVASKSTIPKATDKAGPAKLMATSRTASRPRHNSRNDLMEVYRGLCQKAKRLSDNNSYLRSQQEKYVIPQSGVSAKVQAIIEGQDRSGTVPASPISKPQLVAHAIQAYSEKAMEIAIADFEDNLDFMRGRPYDISDDAVRDNLVKRMRDVQETLSETMKIYCEIGLMHVEHENFKRRYANDETMFLMEPVKDIPRDKFFVTEDNYAWDMSELVQAITANGGVMRNPLSRQMFTAKDIRWILMSPYGGILKALQVAQHEMSQGIRSDTISRMEKLANVMLAEEERDQMGSRKEMDEFQAYVATLPEREQEAIEAFRCPALDKHTRQAYDSTIGQTIRDAKATEMCIHKAGDFIQQAAAHLKGKRGLAPEVPKKEKSCVIM